MLEHLQAAFARYGRITIMEMAFEVAFMGESWAEVCAQAEQVTSCAPGLYQRLRFRLGPGQTLASLIEEAFERVVE